MDSKGRPEIGDDYGCLKVLGMFRRNGVILWSCCCDPRLVYEGHRGCGNMTEATTHQLKHFRKLSCGCRQKRAFQADIDLQFAKEGKCKAGKSKRR